MNIEFILLQEVLDTQSPQCLIDALYRQQIRERHPDGTPRIDETDIHMITREAIGAGGSSNKSHIFSLNI